MNRLDRVTSLLKKEISDIIIHKINDTRIGLVSITHIDISPDLRNAKVYYSVFGDEDTIKKTKSGLQSASKFIKGELGKVLQFQFVPHIRYIYDNSLEKGSDIVNKIASLNNDD